MRKVSSLIFSMNRVENVLEIVKRVHDYVDDIVIIDSSDEERYNLLKNSLPPKAKVYWVPPIGIVELYYKLGIKLCKYDWIFQLDDDDYPSNKLLKMLKNFDPKSKVYRIKCIDNANKRRASWLIRLYNRNYIVPTGIIHLVNASKIKCKYMNEKCKIINRGHKFPEDRTKLRRYAVIEAYQLGYKLYRLLFPNYYKEYSPLAGAVVGFAKKLFRILSKFGKVGWYFLASLFNLYYFMDTLFYAIQGKTDLVKSIMYHFSIQFHVTKNFSRKLGVWKKIINAGDSFKFMGLETLRDIRKLEKELDLGNNGLENFIKVIEWRSALKIFD